MNKSDFRYYIEKWNINHPFDKIWRDKHSIPLFSKKHKEMCLVDILMEVEEDKMYKEITEEYLANEKRREESSVLSLRDKDYIPGRGNFLTDREDSLSEEEKDDLFNNIKI